MTELPKRLAGYVKQSPKIYVACVWTETRPERRKFLEKTLSNVLEDPRFVINWIGTRETEAPQAYRYFRDDAKPFAGLSAHRAWLTVRRNSQTLAGSSRRASTWIARRDGIWELLHGRRLTVVASRPSPLMDDCTRKHLLALDSFLDSDSDWLLGLEDDAIGEAGWSDRAIAAAKQFGDAGAPAVFIAASEGCNLSRTSSDPMPDGLGLFRVSPPTSRTACAYLMNRAAASSFQRILRRTGVRPHASMGFDFLVAFMVLRSSTRVYWVEPPLFLHGSERGIDGLASHRLELATASQAPD